MRISTQMFSFALFAGLLAGGLLFFQPASASEDRAGAWLPIPRLIEKLEAAGYRNIERIEREHGRYEVRATNRQGERSKLRLDARTGELLGAQYRDGEGVSGRHDARHVGRAEGGGECNKRRCRDDMPAAPAGSR